MNYTDYDSYNAKKPAYPWGMNWPKMKYTIVDKKDMLNWRKQLAKSYEKKSGNPPPRQLKDNEIELPYSDYIVPLPFDRSKNQPNFYDPLEGFVGMHMTKEPPYLDIVKLNLDDSEAVLDYINEHGLLGIFFHRFDYYAIEYPEPDLDATDIDVEFTFTDQKKRTETITIDALWGIWMGRSDYKYQAYPATNKYINDRFFPLLEDFYEPRFMTPYRKEDIEKAKIITKSKGKVTTLDETKPVPLEIKKIMDILDKGDNNQALEKVHFENMWFWSYCEPLELYIDEAKKFQALFADVEKINNILREKKKGDLDHADQALLYKIITAVKRNAQNISPRPKYDVNKRAMIASWEVPSLLSAYYLMLYLDLVSSRNAKICQNDRCNRPFIAEREDNIYCGPLCKDAAKKRRRYWNRKKIEV